MEKKELTFSNIKDLDEHGVYHIFLFDSEGEPSTINRFIGSDPSGLIYIGAAEKTTIRYRLNAFLRSMDVKYKQNNHSAGNKVLKNEGLNGLVDLNRLFFSVVHCANAKEMESEAIHSYAQKYGEVPPLNG
jgi:hypothetical protein